MDSSTARTRFLEFFAAKGHEAVASSPLVPANDPTLLFTNAGMVQFKDTLLGFERRDYATAATSQRCLRAGGKHNDLENVGYTARHHTFFEMLGNFSFGDYFKEKAIPYAWELLTTPQDQGGYGLAPAQLWITVFGGGRLFGEGSEAVPADDEAAAIWIETLTKAGFSPKEAKARITAIPTADNFWMMGDTGPCGPCSEIFYNRDPKAGKFEGEDPAKADACVEIWNLVFMQFNRSADGTLKELPAPCVDTGMGLERLSAVLQDVDSNYATDLFVELIGHVKEAVTEAGGSAPADSPSLRVIADHIRAAAFLVADKVLPSNEGRGYVLRRIIRRALRHGHQLGAREPFFATLAAPLAKLMGAAHPELGQRLAKVTAALLDEEERFARTLSEGMRILAKTGKGAIDGATVFKLYDTYGFPTDLTESYARDHGIKIDMEGFATELAAQQKRSRAASEFKAAAKLLDYAGAATTFVEDVAADTSGEVLALYDAEGEPSERLEEGARGIVVLSDTAFYAEAGGQVGDRGVLAGADGENATVLDTIKVRNDVHGHQVEVAAGVLEAGTVMHSRVDAALRQANCRAHTATHLLHEALRRRLGEHVEQRGSYVADDRLRFDFAHDKPLSAEDLAAVEEAVCAQALANAAVVCAQLPYKEAIAQGARALFGEKYGATVRMVTVDPEFSRELCGGTHVASASEVGHVQLRADEAIAAGIRRIEASTGFLTQRQARFEAELVAQLSTSLKKQPSELFAEIASLRKALQAAQKDAAAGTQRALVAKLGQLHDSQGGGSWLVAEVEADARQLKEAVVEVGKVRKLDVVACIGTKDRPVLVVWANPKAASKADAKELVARYAPALGARGGGSATLAQAGGGDSAKVGATLAQIRKDIPG